MVEIPGDWDSIPDSNFTPVPKGTYDAIIREVELTYSKAGNPMLKLELEIDRGEYEGRTLFDHAVLTENALWKLKAIGSAADVHGEGNQFPHEELINKHVTVKVEHKDYEGEPQAKIKRYSKGVPVDEFAPTKDDLPDFDNTPNIDDADDEEDLPFE